MHLSEFKAWFEGFTEEMDGTPNKAQWAKIKKHVKEISADYTPAPVFVDRYVYPWRRYWDQGWPTYLSTSSTSGVTGTASGTLQNYKDALAAPSLNDWSHAGRAEYKSTL